jgi:hypothetical protein
MPRGRRKVTAVKTEQETGTIATVPTEQDVSVPADLGGGTELPIDNTSMPPSIEPTDSASTVAELREATQEILDRSEAASAKLPQRERFRSWVTDTTRGYARWSDNEYQRIILQFNERPSQEILAAVKEAGFHFQKDYCGLENAWVRRNDYTGRVHVDAIERLIRAQTVGTESPAL